MSGFAVLTAFEAALTDLPVADTDTAAKARARLDDMSVFPDSWQGEIRPTIERARGRDLR